MRTNISTLLLLATLNIFGQQDPILISMKSNLEKYSRAYDPQKVFVDFDQDYYLSGETINFSIFITKHNGKILQEEEVVYLDFLTKDKVVNSSIKVSTKAGRAFGSIAIPDSLKATKIKVSAYTRWMANLSKAFYFQEELTVYNRNDRNLFDCEEDVQKVERNWGTTNLVANVPNQVPFYSMKKYTPRLLVVDGDGDSVLAMEQDNAFAVFEPKTGVNYFIKDQSGNIEKLPSVNDAGIAISFKEENNNLNISLNSNLKPAGDLRFFVQNGNNILYQSVYNSREKSKDFSLPKDILGGGLLLFGIIDDQGDYLAYRYYDLDTKNNSLLVASMSKREFQPKEKVIVNLSLSEKAFSMGGTFSVKVSKRNGRIAEGKSLNAYIKKNSDFLNEKKQSLENWKYNPLRVQEGLQRKTGYQHEYNAVTIRGQVLDANGNPVSEQSFVFFFAGQKLSYNGRTDENGEVVFQTEPFYGTEYVVIQPLFPDVVGPVTFKQFDDIAPAMTFVDCGIETVISAVSEGVVKEYENQRIRNAYENGTWEITPSEDDVDPLAKFYYREIVLNDYAAFKTMEEVIVELLSTVRLIGKNKKMRVYDNERTISFRDTPNFLIDGRPVTDQEEIFKLDPSTIYSIGVINTIGNLREFYVFGKNGIVVFNSIDAKVNRPKELNKNVFLAEGFTPFNEGSYSLSKAENNPDFRSTIFWDPNFKIEKDSGVRQLAFETSDDLGEYEIRISGVTDTGNLIEFKKSFTVQK